MRQLAAGLLLMFSLPLMAADIRDVDVDRENGIYSMRSVVHFDATIEQLYEVLIDWDLSTQFSSIVKESRNVEPDELGRPQYFSRIEACVAFFCRSFDRNGFVETEANEWIRATTDPERSDFHLSNETWTFVDEEQGAVVIYELEFKPKFWVPPVIGPFLIKRKLRQDGPEALTRIEAIAQTR